MAQVTGTLTAVGQRSNTLFLRVGEQVTVNASRSGSGAWAAQLVRVIGSPPVKVEVIETFQSATTGYTYRNESLVNEYLAVQLREIGVGASVSYTIADVAGDQILQEWRAADGTLAFRITDQGPIGGVVGSPLNVKAFGAKGDGVTDDTAAIQSAFNAAGASDTVMFPPGRYRVTQVTRTGTSLHIVGYGATVVQQQNVQAILLRGGYTTVNVSAVTQSTYDFGNSGTIPCTVISVAALPSGAAVGRYVKLVSDDVLPFNRPALGATVARTGEYAMIGAIVGTDIYIPNYLQESYTTNIRLGLLADVSFTVEGLAFEANADDSGWTTFAVAILEARSAHSCRFINLTCTRAWGAFLRCVGVRGYTVQGARVSNCDNNPSIERFGYGIDDCSSDGAMISGCTFSYCRHSITTSGDRIPAGATALEYYGRSIGGRVANCQAFSNAIAGFDTHLGAYDWEFINCRASRCEYGFQLRGRELRVTDGVADRCWRGIQVSNDGGSSGATDQVFLTNCYVYLATERALLNAAAVGCVIWVDGGQYSTASVTTLSPVQLAVSGTMYLTGNVRITQNSTANGAVAIVLSNTSSIAEIVGAVTLDLSAASGSSVRAVRMDGANATLRGAGRLSVLRGGAAGLGYVFQGAQANFGIVQLGDVFCDVAPTTGILGSNLQTTSYAISQLYGNGTPEGAVAANVGSTFRRADGGAGTSLYVKETGTGNTGWIGK